MLARFMFGPKEMEKERRLNRQARRFDPQHRVESFQRFVPSHGHICQDPAHDLLHGGARIDSSRQLLAYGLKFPVKAFRRQRGGGWAWVKIYRPDGHPIIPRDAPSLRGLEYFEPFGPRLPPRLPHGLDNFCPDFRHDNSWAPRSYDDEWEHISLPDGPHYPRDGSGRRPSFHRHRPAGTLHHGREDSIYGDHHPHLHQHRGHHNHSPHSRHHLGPRSLYDGSEFSDWLGERGSAYPRHHDTDHLRFFRPGPSSHRQEPQDSATNDQDDDLFYYRDSDEDEEADINEDAYSNAEISTKSSW